VLYKKQKYIRFIIFIQIVLVLRTEAKFVKL